MAADIEEALSRFTGTLDDPSVDNEAVDGYFCSSNSFYWFTVKFVEFFTGHTLFLLSQKIKYSKSLDDCFVL